MPLTRFAPAPTGVLHLGHVVNAIYVWGLGRTLGAKVILRMEDHDRTRSRAAYETAILDDLDWLGFAADLFPTEAFRRGRCGSRQSDRHDIYASHASRLARDGQLYGCVCSRQELVARRSSGDTVLAYPGTCRDRAIPLTNTVAWRVRLDGKAAGPIEEILAEEPPTDRAGDPVIRDRRGHWTYQFAVTVDDFEQDVDLVIRGRDLQDSTGLQVRLARLIGRDAPPRFAHHPLVMKTATAKLSKSEGDSGVSTLRADGWAAAEVIGRAAHLARLTARESPLPADSVDSLFRRFAPGDPTKRSHQE